jgi:hypothetical protein
VAWQIADLQEDVLAGAGEGRIKGEGSEISAVACLSQTTVEQGTPNVKHKTRV